MTRLIARRDTRERVMFLTGLIAYDAQEPGTTGPAFCRELAAMGGGFDVLLLNLHSPGGSVRSSWEIHNALRSHPARVEVNIRGRADSGGSLIAMAGDSIALNITGSIFVHCIHVDGRLEFPGADAANNKIAEVYASKTGLSVATWREWMRQEKTFDAREARAIGLVDRIDFSSRYF